MTNGQSVDPLPRLPNIQKVGVGHSLGARTILRIQATYRTFDRLCLLGYTSSSAQLWPRGPPLVRPQLAEGTPRTFLWDDVPTHVRAVETGLQVHAPRPLRGPQGAGALIVRDPGVRLPPLLRGGGQERGARAGTENVAAIVGFGAAAEQLSQTLLEEINRVTALRERLETGMRTAADSTVIFSDTALRVPNTTCFAIAGMAAETAVIAFDLEGIAVSAGAACSSGKVGPSPTLTAMKIEPEISRAAVRVSLGWNTTELDVERFLEIFARFMRG